MPSNATLGSIFDLMRSANQRGAFYWKFITDREIARMAYWEISGLFARKRRGAGAWRTLRMLVAGAACQGLPDVRGTAPR